MTATNPSKCLAAVVTAMIQLFVGCAGSSNSINAKGASYSGSASYGDIFRYPIPDGSKIIFKADFEQDPEGPYGRSLLNKEWGTPSMSINGIEEGRVAVIKDNGGKVIAVKYPIRSCGPKDSDGCGKGGGAQWLMPLSESFNELYLSYKVKFADGFNFVRGGKLPGLTASANRMHATPPTGGKKPGPCNGFSARFMWRGNGVMETYLYSPAQPNIYGEELFWKTNGSLVHILPGKWHTVTERLVMNTPGTADGIVEIWLDGIKVQSKTDAYFRGAACPNLGINQFYFSTFFGGDDPSWAAVKDEDVYFDDFVIAIP